jgi:hypothetical protein
VAGEWAIAREVDRDLAMLALTKLLNQSLEAIAAAITSGAAGAPR